MRLTSPRSLRLVSKMAKQTFSFDHLNACGSGWWCLSPKKWQNGRVKHFLSLEPAQTDFPCPFLDPSTAVDSVSSCFVSLWKAYLKSLEVTIRAKKWKRHLQTSGTWILSFPQVLTRQWVALSVCKMWNARQIRLSDNAVCMLTQMGKSARSGTVFPDSCMILRCHLWKHFHNDRAPSKTGADIPKPNTLSEFRWRFFVRLSGQWKAIFAGEIFP